VPDEFTFEWWSIVILIRLWVRLLPFLRWEEKSVFLKMRCNILADIWLRIRRSESFVHASLASYFDPYVFFLIFFLLTRWSIGITAVASWYCLLCYLNLVFQKRKINCYFLSLTLIKLNKQTIWIQTLLADVIGVMLLELLCVYLKSKYLRNIDLEPI
jgi:hypothetical protein